MNGAFYQGAGYVPPGGAKMEEQRRQEQWDEYQRQQQAHRESMGDIAEDATEQSPPPKPTSRKRADSLQPASSSPPQSRRSADVQQCPDQAVISAYLRSSYHDDVAERPRRFSSAEHYSSSSPPAHYSSQGDIGRLSGNFNAPTHVEVERHRDHKRSSRGLGKLKHAVRGLVKA